MKQLILLRHGKSNWGDPGLSDHDRVLNARGEWEAPEMGKRLNAMQIQPDLIVCSTALRAVETAEKFAEELAYPKQAIKREPALYLADVGDWEPVVRALDPQWKTVVMVGHNPGITEFANTFLKRRIADMATCGMLVMTFQCEYWSELGRDELSTANYDYPN